MRQGAALGVPPMSIIIGLNDEDVRNVNRTGLVEKIKASGRPLTLTCQLPPGVAPPVAPSSDKWAKELGELRAMGFTDDAASRSALEASSGDVGAAVSQLVG